MSDKAKRGTKRLCGGCSAKFYDLGRDPIICPLCETVFEVKKVEPKPKKAEVKPVKPEPEKKVVAEGDEILDGEDDLIDIDDSDEVPSTEDDDTFLEVEDEPETAVTSIIPTPGGTKDEEI